MIKPQSALLMALSAIGISTTVEAQKPNIIYIFTDQHTASALSCAGNKDLHTPNIDKLADKGVRFINGYCAAPLSTPSRASMFTGMPPGQTNQLLNQSQIPEAYLQQTLGTLMEQGGYDCAYGGKWHIPTSDIPNDEFGFTHIHPHNDYGLAESCIAFIKQKRKKPFFLVASFDNPHNICEYARGQKLPFAEIQEPTQINHCPMLPPNFAIQPYDAEIIQIEKTAAFRLYPTLHYGPDQWRRYRNAYYRLVETVDAEIGKIINTLEENQLFGSTLIIFSSDHGDGVGAHQWNQKSALYEEVVNIPLLVKLPNNQKAGTISHTLVNNGVDLIPTLCSFAKIAVPTHCKGRSFIEPLTSNHSIPREYVVCETLFDSGSSKGWMVRSQNFKYILYDKGQYREQLYDMEQDRAEMVNLALDSRYQEQLHTHRRMLQEWISEHNIKLHRSIMP